MAIYKEDLVNIDLENGNIFRSFLTHTIGSGDNSANRFGVKVYRAGVAEDLSGCSCQAIFMNNAGVNIALTSYGTVSGNVAYVTLPQACYNVEGQFCLAIKLVKSGVTVTSRIVDGVVCNTGTTGSVAPTSSVPTYQEILDQYAAMVAATAAANGAIAATYSSSSTYKVGDYCIHDGGLYRCTTAITTGEAWTAAHWEAAKIGPDVSDLKSALTSRTENIFDYYSLIEGSYTDSSGNIVSRAGCYRTDYIPVEGGATYARYIPDATSNNYYYAFYNSSKQFISRYNIKYSHTYEFPATAAYVIISSYDVTFQESFTIVKSNERIYYSAPYYKLKNKALYENFDETFTQPGMIADAKATGDKFRFITIDTPNLYDYTKNEENKFYDASGNYTSDTGSYLSDFIPVESGESYSYYGNSALYLNTFNSNKEWQARTKADGSSVTINSGISYVRFGMYKQNFVNGFMFVHGSMPDKDYPYTKMINPVLIPPEDETVDDGLIDVEGHTGYFYHYHKTKSGKYLRYKFNHFTNVSSNADGWVQRDVELVNSLKSQELMKVVYDGEWEMAIQIHGAPDFIGCQNHGSEVSTIVNMYVDGIKTTISDGDSFSCKEIKVNQKSTMYDPTDETTIVGYHYKSHIITKNSIKIEQRIEWVRDVTTDKSYVLMMPAIRGNDSVSAIQVTDHAYDNWNYEESDVATTTFNPSGIGSQKYRGNKFGLYGATSKISIECICDIKDRPESSFAYLSNASYYNKWYCGYCGDSFTVNNGDIWEWISEYCITYEGN